MILKDIKWKVISIISFLVMGILFTMLTGCNRFNFYPVKHELRPVYYPKYLPIRGRVYIEHLGAEPGVQYCGHRFTATFESFIPNVRLMAVIFDFNPSQNTDFEDMVFVDLPPCKAYGVLRKNFGGFFIHHYPDAIPLVHIYSDNPQDPERGIKSGESVIGRFKLKKKQESNSDAQRPNAPDLVGTRVILQFSNDIEIGTTLVETGDLFTASGRFDYP